MPCPFFYPLQPAVLLSGPEPARAPLHAIHDGTCRAADEERTPPFDLLERYCNFGYGRRGCEWFPATSSADAVRFAHRGEQVIYILEKDWFPVSHGEIEGAGDVVRRQAEVFVQHFPKKQRTE